jgi:PAS domain S-box-containing protein
MDSDQDRLDPRMRESEERYRAVIDNASDMIQSIRPDGTFEFVNPAWLRTLGYTPEEVDHLIIFDIVHPDEMEHCQQIFAAVMQGQSLDDLRTTFITKDGRPVPVEGSVTVRFVGDEIVATHAFIRDISERLRAEELAARNEQLERERVARYLEKMAALGKLAAGLAHELNNPAAAAQRASAELQESLARRDAAVHELTALDLQGAAWETLATLVPDRPGKSGDAVDPLAVSELEEAVENWLAAHAVDESWTLAPALIATGVTEEALNTLAGRLPPSALSPAVRLIAESQTVRQAAEVICRSAERMSDLVSAVKAYSHMDRATEQVADVHEGIENTLVMLAHRVRDVTIVRDYDRTLPAVRAYGNGLNQVWTNIIDNAIDAMGKRGTLTIRTYRAGERVAVEISDSGSGIAEQDLTRIFEPFFTTKPQGSGTGLGLDTAWRIVTEEHGGMIEVESEPGRTTFTVLLPVGKAT